jgi:hypothetical protein
VTAPSRRLAPLEMTWVYICRKHGIVPAHERRILHI